MITQVQRNYLSAVKNVVLALTREHGRAPDGSLVAEVTKTFVFLGKTATLHYWENQEFEVSISVPVLGLWAVGAPAYDAEGGMVNIEWQVGTDKV